MDDSQVSNTEKYVNRAHCPAIACILQSTAPLVYRYYRTTTHLVSRQIYFHHGEQNWGTEATGHILGQEPASCWAHRTSWLLVCTLPSCNTSQTIPNPHASDCWASVNSSVLISQRWPHCCSEDMHSLDSIRASSKANPNLSSYAPALISISGRNQTEWDEETDSVSNKIWRDNFHKKENCPKSTIFWATPHNSHMALGRGLLY